MGLTQTVAPTTEPVTTAEARTQVRYTVADAGIDTYLDSLVEAAREFCETFTTRQFVSATYEWTLDAFPSVFYVPRPPLESVTSITYIDAAGDTQTLSPSIYDFDTTGVQGRIVRAYNQSWPSVRGDINSVTVTFVGGYGEYAADVPSSIKHAMLMLIGHWFINREDVTFGPASSIPMGVKALLWPYRILEVG